MNPFSRQLLFVLFVLFTLPSYPLFAQDVNVPDLVKQPYYTEHTTFDVNTFYHRVGYNRPHSVDEEHVYTLMLQFSDFEEIKAGQTLNLATDTALVRSSFGILSVWTWDYDAKASITGTITIISKTKKEIVIEEDVRICDREGKIRLYKSRKTFAHASEN